ncbi:hypothetical protein KKF04_01985 [Patescibacteria group bacterium]|nr:hypothetical protein [Patescibacteria group bacterium]
MPPTNLLEGFSIDSLDKNAVRKTAEGIRNPNGLKSFVVNDDALKDIDFISIEELERGLTALVRGLIEDILLFADEPELGRNTVRAFTEACSHCNIPSHEIPYTAKKPDKIDPKRLITQVLLKKAAITIRFNLASLFDNRGNWGQFDTRNL